MNENRQIVCVGDHLQKPDDVLFLGVPGFRFKTHAFQTRTGDLVLVRMKRAQVDDGPDAQQLQLLYAFSRRLGAAVEICGDLGKIADARHFQGLGPVFRADNSVGFAGKSKGGADIEDRDDNH